MCWCVCFVVVELCVCMFVMLFLLRSGFVLLVCCLLRFVCRCCLCLFVCVRGVAFCWSCGCYVCVSVCCVLVCLCVRLLIVSVEYYVLVV